MFVLIVGLLVFGLVEVSLLVALANAVSWEVMLLLVILSSAAGAWVVKREGTATWRRVMSGVRAGQMPTNSVLDGCLAVVGGFLLLVPGLLTDLAAVALLIPPVRSLVRQRAVDGLQRRIATQVSRARTTTVFGFGEPSTFSAYQRPGGDTSQRGPVRDDDIIDLDAEEVFLDEPIAEIDPPRDRSTG